MSGCWFFCGVLCGAALTAGAAWWIRRRRRREIEALSMTPGQFRAGLYRWQSEYGAQQGPREGARPRAPRRPRKA